MARKTFQQLKTSLEADSSTRDSLRRLFAISDFSTVSILPTDYHFPGECASAIALTKEGEAVAEAVTRSSNAKWREADLVCALLGAMTGQGPLVDPHETDHEALRQLLSAEVRAGTVRYPMVSWRELYDTYFSRFGPEHVELSPESTQQLLEATSQGVFQLDELVSGPLGLLQSNGHRYVPPTTSAPLSHCRDPGCTGIHPIRMRTGRTDAGDAYRAIGQFLNSQPEPPPPWDELKLDIFIPDSQDSSDVNAGDLPWFVGNALSNGELAVLVESLIQTSQEFARRRLAEGGVLVERRSVSDIVASLNRSAILQAILLFTDEDIVETLEQLLFEKRILVPPPEVRKAPFSGPGSRGIWRQHAELSSLGLRFVSDRADVGILRLRALLRQLYSDNDLRWQLMEYPGRSLEEQLESMLTSEDVTSIAERTLLARGETFNGTVFYLHYGDFPIPASRSERDAVRSRLLWKLGFDVHESPELPTIFWRRFAALRAAVGPSVVEGAAREEEVRSVAVNVFVSLEELLDEALSFAAWALFFDHYGAPRSSRFTYNLDAARLCMEKLLNGRLVGGEPLALNATGRNTLYALISGFSLLARLVEDAYKGRKGAAEEQRDSSWFPIWSRYENCLKFPFVHRTPLLDLAGESISDIVGGMRAVVTRMHAGDVMGVRNRIPHGGGVFSDGDSLRACLSAIEDSVNLLEGTGLFPLVFNYVSSSTDEFGRRMAVLRDYRGRSVTLSSPSELLRVDLPSTRDSQLVMKCARITSTAAVLRFRYQVSSEYAEMWADYPRVLEAAPDEVQQASQREKDSSDEAVGVIRGRTVP